MRKDYIHKQFWKYVLPSMFTMLLSGFYAIIDGLFVGNAAGSEALAAINLVWPLQAFLNACAVGIGIGSAVLMSTYLGQDNKEKAANAAGMGVLLLLFVGIVLPILMYVSLPYILNFLGAEDTLYIHAKEYITIVLMGGIFPILGNGFNPIIRNQGRTISATIIMSSGLITNIILDYVFVFDMKMGLFGAGLATILAQAIVVLCSFLYLWMRNRSFFHIRNYLLNVMMIKKILMIGIAPFGQTFVPSIVIVLTNWQCIKYGGNTAVTIFSVVSYILATVQLLLQGIGDGVQPLLSFYHGSKKEKELHILYHKSLILSLLVSCGLALLVVIGIDPLTSAFGVQDTIKEATEIAVIITAFSFPFLGIARLTSAYFYAIEKAKNSTFLVYIEPCLLLPLCLTMFSALFQLTGVWVAYPAAQVVLACMALIMKSPNVSMKFPSISTVTQSK